MDCLSVLVELKAARYPYLQDRLKQYFGNMIHEQRLKAINRLEWLCVDEVVRPDTSNKQFIERYEEIGVAPGLGTDIDANRDTYIQILQAYLPVAQERYCDSAIRMVTTHILDVPLGKERTIVKSEQEPDHGFQAHKICLEKDLEELLRTGDQVTARRNLLKKKITQLSKLRTALEQQPRVGADNAEVGVSVVNAMANGIAESVEQSSQPES